MLQPEIHQRAQDLLKHDFRDASLLAEALTHSSAADSRLHSNERMEFLGDAVLDLVVCEELYRRFPDYFEGEMTKLKSAVVSRKTCAIVARETGLDELLIVGKGVEGRRIIPSSLSAGVYESVIAAIYLDGGFEPARRYVLETITPHIDALAVNLHQHNYKAVLQQHVQKTLETTPHYELLDEKGPDHAKCFEICVSLEGQRYPGAWGPSKKQAEQKAALLALHELGLVPDADFEPAMEAIDSIAPIVV
jgi:ribonuclease-3